MSDFSEDLVPTGRARGRSRGLDTAMGGLRVGERRPGEIYVGRGRGSVPRVEGKGRGEASSGSGSSSSSIKSSLSSPHGGSSSSSEGPIQALGRGATRGIRTRTPLELRTRPEDLNKKLGAGGSPIDLLTNYFSLVQQPDWALHQYAVTFNPDIEDSRVSLVHMNSVLESSQISPFATVMLVSV